MAKTTPGASAPPNVTATPFNPVVFEVTQIVRQAHGALACICCMAAQTEEPTELDARQVAYLLMPVRDLIYGALDELEAASMNEMKRIAAEVNHA